MRQEDRLLAKRYRYDGRPLPSVAAGLPPGGAKVLVDVRQAIESKRLPTEAYTECPLCGNDGAWRIAAKDRSGLPCDTVICQGCGLCFNDRHLTPSAAIELYRQHWAKLQWGGDPEKHFAHRTRPDAFSWKRYAFVRRALGIHHADRVTTVYEVGCGDGCNLYPFALAGCRVAGCDWDRDFLGVGRRNGLALYEGDSSVLRDLAAPADLVIISHVLEHCIDLEAEIEKAAALIQPGGYVYVEVPGIVNLNRPHRMRLAEDGYESGNDFLLYLQYGHNFHFDLAKLKAFWQRGGFETVIGDEWVRALFRKGDGDRSSSPGHLGGGHDAESGPRLLAHLSDVERDYRAVRGWIRRGLAFAARRL